jgi:hypothetical protein
MTTFSQEKTHNMFVLMFDLRFKGLQIVTKYLNSSDITMEMVDEYDNKFFIPFLTKAYKKIHLKRSIYNLNTIERCMG